MTCAVPAVSARYAAAVRRTLALLVATLVLIAGSITVGPLAPAGAVVVVPSAPTAVVAKADASSTTTLDISWVASTSPDGTSPITGYTVTSTPGSFTCTTATTTCNVTGLTTATNYTFRVTATNSYGASVASTASASKRPGDPGTPTSITAARVDGLANAATGRATVTWRVPNNGGSAVTGQTVTSTPGALTCTDNAHITAGTTASCTVTGLSSGTSYTFQVKAMNANLPAGTVSIASNSVTVQTLPVAPTGVSAIASNAAASVSWEGPVSTTYSGAISVYTVTATDLTDALSGGRSASGASSPITVSGLTNGHSYTFTVSATGVAGAGPASSASSPVTLCTVPSAPTSLVAAVQDGSVTLTFVAGATGGAAISKYQYRIGNGQWVDSGSGSPITVGGLANYTTYSIRLRAVNVVGAGAASMPVSARPKLTGPTITLAHSYGNHGVLVGFAFDRLTDSVLIGFTVRAYVKGTTTVVSSCQVSVSARGCAVVSLVAGTQYDFRAQAYLRPSGSPVVRETRESAAVRVRVND